MKNVTVATRRKWLFGAIITAISAMIAGCAAMHKPIQNQGYQAEVGAEGFINSMRAAHPECKQVNSNLCDYLNRAAAAQNVLADALKIFCAGPDFMNGGACNPPAKGTPAYTQAAAKLQAAIKSYSQIEADLKQAAKGYTPDKTTK